MYRSNEVICYSSLGLKKPEILKKSQPIKNKIRHNIINSTDLHGATNRRNKII